MVLVFLESPVPPFRPTDEQVERLRARLGDTPVRLCRSEEEFLRHLPEARVALVWAFYQEWFERAPKLRLIATPAAGRDYFRVTPPVGVTLHYGTFHGAIMAETALAAVLSMVHGLLPFAESMRGSDGGWPRTAIAHQSRRLASDTVAVLGCGHIGSAFASLVRPFARRVIGIHRSRLPETADGIEHVLADRLDDVLPEADHLVCFLPSGPETDSLLDARRISLLRPGAVLYNFGRGNLIDEDALARALREGRLGGAVLDVFHEEPLPPSSPLRTAPRCFLYPHSSAFSPDYLDLWFSEIIPFL